ncbi:unnamed protein product [Phytophthora lilii]|uniref:Unnamed protein product n=1 Tax=Phytophthora lilii TaxID=2077276 RepID=A0A9W7D8Z6_9STRA|nr:unnamed protein product [Phytophthora lilii]
MVGKRRGNNSTQGQANESFTATASQAPSRSSSHLSSPQAPPSTAGTATCFNAQEWTTCPPPSSNVYSVSPGSLSTTRTRSQFHTASTRNAMLLL